MAKPNRYVLGSTPEIDLTFYNPSNEPFSPSESRLSIKRPDGVILTYSGADLNQGSGYLYFIYNPPTIGWYEYEGWGKDGNGREIASTAGFEVYDRVY